MNRKYSLKKSKDIDRVYHLKNSIGNSYYAIYLGPCINNQLRIAISISKRCGNAVVRNHEKRIAREILRPQIANFIKRDYLVVIKPKAVELSFTEKREQINNLLSKKNIQQGERNE